MISVRDTKEFAKTSHLQCLYPSFNVCIHVLHAYKNMDVAKERISLTLELMAMFLSFQMTYSLVTAAVVWAIVEYFRLGSFISSYSSQVFKAMDGLQFLVVYGNVSLLMPLVSFVIKWVFSALICMPYAVEASSRRFTNLTSSCSCPARPPMSSAKRKFVVVLPPILTIPSWSSSASDIILSKTLKRVGESRHPIVVRNHSPMLLSW